MIETTVDEQVLKPAQKRRILHEYGEPIDAEIRVYAERGWSRSRARDYYDLWRLLMTFRDRMDLADFPSFFRENCAIRSVVFSGPGDFFQDRMLAYVEKTWDHWLGPLTPGLPAYQALIDELRPQVASLFPASR